MEQDTPHIEALGASGGRDTLIGGEPSAGANAGSARTGGIGANGGSLGSDDAYDYAFVSATARIALYDDLMSAPRITEIHPAETGRYIENLASTVYEQAQRAGGSIPYTVIREVSENFIHARFKEIIVSVLDHGNTIRFADQGPGIAHKDKAQLPGFSSAVEPMKSYIRGVGSGLPIVREYLEFSHGAISIEDNMGAGSVVTISLNPERVAEARAAGAETSAAAMAGVGRGEVPNADAFAGGAAGGIGGGAGAGALTGSSVMPVAGVGARADAGYPIAGAAPAAGSMAGGFGGMTEAVKQGFQRGFPAAAYVPQTHAPSPTEQYAAFEARRVEMTVGALSERERVTLVVLLQEGALGVTELSKILDMPVSSTYQTLGKLDEAGLVGKVERTKQRMLTPLGEAIARSL